MRSIWIIFKRELTQYFVSPIAYMVAFAMLVLCALNFNSDLERRVLNAQPPDGTIVITAFAFFMIFFAPLLTMRLLSEEAREKTLELLLTLPVKDSEVVLGKFLGAWAYYTSILAVTIVYPLIMLSITTFSNDPLHADMDIGPVIAGYMGIWLFGGATIAVGLLFSATTENQIVAGFLSMATLFILWLGDLAGLLPASIVSTDLAKALRVISLQSHYSTSFVRGVIRFEDVVFYAGIMAVMLFATIQIFGITEVALMMAHWIRQAGWIGTLLLFAALIAYLFDREISARAFALLAAGLVSLGLWIIFAPDDLRGWLSGRQAAAGTASFILTIAFAAFVVVVYVQVDRQDITIDFTRTEQFTLNTPSLQVIDRLQLTGRTVRLVGFFRTALQELEAADIILRQYDLEGGDAIQVQVVDPNEEPLIARQFAYTQYVAISNTGQQDVLFVALLTEDGQLDPNTIRPVYPVNERTISTEILQLITISDTKFYFTTGHTEFDFASQAGTGLSRAVAGGLGALNIQVDRLNLLTQDIPLDASALVIAGNSQPFVQEEVDKIAAYVARGGRLIVMVNPPYVDATFGGVSVPLLPDSPLGQYLWNEFGVRPQASLVVDYGSSFDTEFNPVVAAMNSQHPIIQGGGIGQDTAIVFSLATSFEIVEDPQGAQANYVREPLLATSPDSYGETSLEVVQSGVLSEFDETSDLPGPILMGVAISTIGGVNEELGTRVVIIGDIDWLSNDFVVNFPGNAALWAGMASWVVGTTEGSLIDAVNDPTRLPVSATEQTRQRISLITTLVLPSLVLILGAAVAYRRRRY